ncbi:MAG: hypothetical protein KGD58_16340 [Candidatus Lokiarchaeota archaeon]|nr:hypothetical protein [Candidatus Lokiarchaeota archaeon]
MTRNKDVLKFFQAYVREMIDIGGENLPKAISVKSGSKLGKFYKERMSSLDLEVVLKKFYGALKGKATIKKLDDNNYDVSVKYSKKFCPIGGTYDPSRGTVFQENICIPYTKGFLSETFPHIKTEAEFLNCIPCNNKKTCHYILKVKEITK